MIILLSPAKKLSVCGDKFTEFTHPKFVKESQKLIEVLQKYSPKKLQELMKVSKDIAELNVERYAKWTESHSIANSKQAILTFTGEVYNGLKSTNFTKQDFDYAQNHLRILSGLYGVLKPLDLVQEYRLEMGTKLKFNTYNNLYNFWGDKIVNELNETFKSHNNKTIINLASAEYYKSINTKKLNAKVITPIFKDGKSGEYKIVMMYAKKARGLMANYIIKNQLENVEDLLGFTEDGYYFNPKLSTESELMFYRG